MTSLSSHPEPMIVRTSLFCGDGAFSLGAREPIAASAEDDRPRRRETS